MKEGVTQIFTALWITALHLFHLFFTVQGLLVGGFFPHLLSIAECCKAFWGAFFSAVLCSNSVVIYVLE